MPDTGCFLFSPRYDSVLPTAMLNPRHKQHLEGWGADMSRHAGLGIFDIAKGEGLHHVTLALGSIQCSSKVILFCMMVGESDFSL